jgi:hypothetical protein
MRENSPSLDPVSIDDDTARLLETIAWDTWLEIDAKLRAGIGE